MTFVCSEHFVCYVHCFTFSPSCNPHLFIPFYDLIPTPFRMNLTFTHQLALIIRCTLTLFRVLFLTRQVVQCYLSFASLSSSLSYPPTRY
jgi:hypothetical protein